MSGVSDAADVRDIAVICGPTAAGKSAIASWLAARTPVTIVSADSRQIYRGFDIGTAKPTRAERRAVPHRAVDIADPEQRYSAAAWSAEADRAIDDAFVAGRIPLVVGGTGLYLRALFDGLFEEPALDAVRRASLDSELALLDTPTLRRWVTELDPARAALGRTQLVRAIEIALLTGRRVSELHAKRRTASRWRARYLVVDPGPVLADRIAARIDEMLDNGWPDEVRHLMQSVVDDAPAWNATGYGVVRRLVRGTVGRAVAHEEILIGTRQYAKRQRTWFRHQLVEDRVTRLDPRAAGWEVTVEQWLDSTIHTGRAP